MDSKGLIQAENLSDRARRLLAVCIQVSLRRRFGRNISFNEASELSRVHTITGLISKMQENLEVQITTLDAAQRFNQALHEAKLGPQGLEERIESRRNVISISENSKSAHVDSERTRRDLLDLTKHVATWRHEYSAFLAALEQLYQKRMTQLQSLKLPPQEFEEACATIDRLFSEAIDKSTDPGLFPTR